MSRKEDKFHRSRVRSSYVSVIISISLVLFMLGLFGVIVLYAKKIGKEVKENIGMTIYLKDDVKDVDVARLQKSLDVSVFVKETQFITKEEAAEMMKAELGEDFVEFIGYNPLLAAIKVKVHEAYAHPDSLASIKANLLTNSKIKEIEYQESLVDTINRNIQRIGVVMGAFSILLLIVSIALINNSIRLSIYSKRFLIKSMQLVGATQGFIRRPFVLKGILHGIYSAIIAIVLIVAVIYYTQQFLPGIFQVEDFGVISMVFGLVLFMGITISWISTSLAVRKFLRMRTDKLY